MDFGDEKNATTKKNNKLKNKPLKTPSIEPTDLSIKPPHIGLIINLILLKNTEHKIKLMIYEIQPARVLIIASDSIYSLTAV